MPSAPPTSRVVSLMAEPTPAFEGGSDETMASVELLTAYEGDAFASTGDPGQDLLSITAVHPMRESAVRRTLQAAGAGWDVVSALMQSGELVEVEHEGHRYYLRPIRS